MPEIERGSSPSGASGYNALRPPELPARPVGGFRNRSVRADTTRRHERLWGRPIGEDALRLAGARQNDGLSARAISVAPSSSERFLPDRRTASGEHTYEPLRDTASPQHVYEQLNVRVRTPPADPHRGIAPSESAGDEPHYEFAPEGFLPDRRTASGEHTYEPLRDTASPQHVYEQLNVRVHTPPAGPHRGIAPSESAGDEPHYEFAPQEPPVEEHDYDFPSPESPLEESYGESGRSGAAPSSCPRPRRAGCSARSGRGAA